MKIIHHFLLGITSLSLSTFTLADTINVNLGITLNDANAIGAEESSTVGIGAQLTHDGSKWNNVLLRTTGAGAPTTFTAATQGSNHIDLNNSSGADAGVDMTSSGAFYSNFSNTSGASASATGDGGMMQSYALANSTESISLSGLSTWAPNGYKVYVYFDIGAVTRTYGFTVSDSTSSQSYFSADTAGTDADTNNDGIMNWIQTSATTSGVAVADANYAVFGSFTGNTLTISGADGNRAPVCGFQVVALTNPPATIVSFTATPSTFTAGDTVTLNWNVTDADTVSIDQGVGSVSATSGSLALTPSATTTWTLTATRNGETTTAQTSATLSKGPIDVYLLGGQSNMQGTARSSKLPNDLLSIPELKLYAAGSGVPASLANKLVDLQPANGGTFGPEIGFGDRLRDLCEGQDIALIKYAASGNSLEINFKPGANATDTANWGGSFTAMVNTYNNGIAALEAEGWEPVIKGMIWQQGEQDAKDGLNVGESDTSADDYGANLSHFIGRVREQFATHASPNGIRFVSGQVLPYAPAGGDVATRFPGRDLVRQAILDSAEDSGAALAVTNAAAVPTNSTDYPSHENEVDGFKDTDEVHLNHVAQLTLGRSMADKMLELSPQTYAEWVTSQGVTGVQTADDDNDGSSNVEEFYQGTDPNDANSFISTEALIENVDGVDYLTLTITRSLNALEISEEAQISEDLIDWNDGIAPVLVADTKNSTTQTIKYRAPWSVIDAAHPKTFLRYKITVE